MGAGGSAFYAAARGALTARIGPTPIRSAAPPPHEVTMTPVEDLSSSQVSVLKSDTLPDHITAFPDAITAGHGGDTTRRFVRQSIGRVSAVRASGQGRLKGSREGQDSRLSSAQLHAVQHNVATDDDWENEMDDIAEDEEEDDDGDGVQVAPVLIRRRGSTLTRKIVDLHKGESAVPAPDAATTAKDYNVAAPMKVDAVAATEAPEVVGPARDGVKVTRSPSVSKKSRRKSIGDEELAQARAFAPEAGAAMARMHKAKALGQSIEGDERLPLAQATCGIFSCGGLDEGKPKANQDCAFVAYPLPSDATTAAFVVLDGHGEHGDVVSNELLAQLHKYIGGCEWGGRSDDKVTKQLVDAFEGAHARLADFAIGLDGKAAGDESGAAGVAVLLNAGRLVMAHVGDCRAVLGTRDVDDGKVVAVELTKDHKLEDHPREVMRIHRAGSFIRPSQEVPYFLPARIFADKDNLRKGPGLTMARSLGDADADEAGVIPTPEVTFRALDSSEDEFIILASDGVWEFLSSEDVVEVVSGFLNRGEPAIVAARFLIAQAALAWRAEEGDYRDDITAIVVYCKDLPRQLLQAQSSMPIAMS